MEFKQDFRQSNPKLHKLYVRWAYETLSVANDAAQQLFDMNKVDASIIAGDINKHIRNLVKENAAYAEAAAMLYAGILLPLEPLSEEFIIKERPHSCGEDNDDGSVPDSAS